MDRSDAAPAPCASPSPAGPGGDAREGRGSQSRIPALFFWILAAAVVLRVVTALVARPASDAGAGLVRWVPAEAAAAAAATASRPVLYDFTAAWCMPCHRLDSEGWSDGAIASKVNEGFVSARVVDREREDGRNTPPIEELQRRFSVNAFPTLIVADASGREIARMEGYGGKDQLAQFLENAKKKAEGR